MQQIKTGEIPNIFEFELPEYMSFLRPLIIKYKDAILENINYDKIIEYAMKYKPRYVPIFRHPEGKKWLERFLKPLKFIIENSHLPANEVRLKFYKTIIENRKKKLLKQQELELQSQQQENTEESEQDIKYEDIKIQDNDNITEPKKEKTIISNNYPLNEDFFDI